MTLSDNESVDVASTLDRSDDVSVTSSEDASDASTSAASSSSGSDHSDSDQSDSASDLTGSETSDGEDSEDGSLVSGGPQDMATARPLPGRTFMLGQQQFSVFGRDGAPHDSKSFEDYASRASVGTDTSAGGEESTTMRRVTASLLEILTQVAAVSKDEPGLKGGKGDLHDLETVTLYDASSASSVDGKALSNHTDDLDVVYQTNMRRLTTTLVDLLGAMNKGGKDGKEFSLKGDPAVGIEDLLLKDPEAGLKDLSGGFDVEYKGDNILPFNSEPEAEIEVEDSAIPAVFKKKLAINWVAGFIALMFFFVFIFYIYFRVAYTMGVGSYMWYAILVFVVEVVGGIAMIPYAITLFRRVVPTDVVEVDSKGLPVTVLKYHIRVMIPCYREPLDVVKKTFLASLSATSPAGCYKSVYLCDDGKDPEKRAFVRSLGRSDAHYVSGRKRAKGEMNGKSANINNIARLLYPEGVTVPLSEVMCIFDADQVPNPDFFVKTVPLMDAGGDVGMVLSPQTFYNLHPECDIFNHANVHFWDYTQPGYDALGLISCTGTNFLVRSRGFLHAGGFPEWTLTEDFALGIELKKRKWQCRYVEEYLAIGEAPEDVRNCFQQRSRWAKGHFQTFFSGHCPMLQRGLSFGMRLMYSSVIVSYLACFTSTPVLLLVPCITIWLGVFPIVINFYAGVCVTVYYISSSLLMYYSRSRSHFKAMWFASICNSILWFAYLKAAYRATVGKYLTGKIVFKSTLKGLQKMKDSALRDVWMALILLATLISSFIVGCIHISKGPIRSPLIISLLWCIYNMIPALLLLWYAFVSKSGRAFTWLCSFMQLLSLGTALAAIILVWPMIPPTYEYKDAVEMQWTFYQAQMSGVLPEGYSISWRGDSHTADAEAQVYDTRYYGNWTAYMEGLSDAFGDSAADNTTVMDLSGGFYTGMAAGLLKHTMPEAFTTATLAWGLLSFPEKYKQAEGTNQAVATIRQGTDYLRKLLWIDPEDENNTAIVSRVGRVDVETKYWGRPEDDNVARPAFSVHIEDGASDLAGSVAAALAAGALVFQDRDPGYAAELLDSAKQFWDFGNVTRAKFTETDLDSQYIYNSTTYYDDMAWGAAWLFRATRDEKYLAEMYNNYVRHLQFEGKYDFGFAYDWDNLFWSTNLVMAQATGFPTFHNQTKSFLRQWICSGSTANYTMYGRAVNPNVPSMGATANAVFMSTMYADMVKEQEPDLARVYQCWALSQLRYMLGDSGRSYVVGYGPSAPERTQDRGAACPDAPMPCNTVTGLLSPEPDPHRLLGALIEGPGLSDYMKDVRNQNASRVGIENNAGFTGAVVGVLDYPEGQWEICLQNYGVYTQNPVCGSYFSL